MYLVLAFLLSLFVPSAHAASGPCYQQDTTGCALTGPLGAPNLQVNVKAPPYNAKCDGSTDDTTAIQSAINAGVSSGKSFTLYFPAGVCRTSAALTITPTAGSGQNIAVKGESRATAQLLVTGTGDGIDFTMSKSTTIFSAQLDVTDLTILASSTAGTAIKATSDAPNSVSPKFHFLRIGYVGSGSFANGISLAHMSNIVVRDVNINSPNATGYAFQFDGDATFPSITDMFSNIYFWGFATGIQIGNGTTSYVQGIEITNAQLQANNQACVVWNNNPAGYLGDQFLLSNSFCNGTITINNVQDIIIQGNYILSGPGTSQINIIGATSGIISNNAFNANNAANTNGLVITGSHTLVVGNNFLNYNASGSAPIVFGSGSSDSLAMGNKCDGCGVEAVVNDFGTNSYLANMNGSTPQKTLNTLQEAWHWAVPATPTLATGGTTMGWNYAGQGEADMFLGRANAGPGGYSLEMYDSTSGSVGNLLLGLDVSGNLHLGGALVGFSGTPVLVQGGLQLYTPVTVASLPTCTTTIKGTFRAVTDAASPAYNVAVTGGGAVMIPVFCNGTAWTAH